MPSLFANRLGSPVRNCKLSVQLVNTGERRRPGQGGQDSARISLKHRVQASNRREAIQRSERCRERQPYLPDSVHRRELGEHSDQPGSPSVLLLAPASIQPALGSIKKIEHEYSLRDELDSAWAVRPLACLQAVLDSCVPFRIRVRVGRSCSNSIPRPCGVHDGKILTTDGPFCRSQRAARRILPGRVRDVNEAVAVAAMIPGAQFGSIEKRPTKFSLALPVCGWRLPIAGRVPYCTLCAAIASLC